MLFRSGEYMRKRLLVLALVLFVIMGFSVSCKKSDPTQPNEPENTPVSSFTVTPSGTVVIFTHTVTQTSTETATETVLETAIDTATSTVTPTITVTATITLTSTPAPPASTCSFGVNSQGTNIGYSGGSSIRLSRFSTSTQITLSKIAYYVDFEGTMSGGSQSAAIYSNSAANAPENLITSTGYTTVSGEGWNTVNLTPVILDPGEYWLAVYLNISGTSYNINTNTQVLGSWYGGSAWSNPWTGGASNGVSGFSIRGICEDRKSVV